MSHENYLGFANLPNQVQRKSVKKGFEFTLMVVGESGLGKSTLINALFHSNLYSNRKIPPVNDQLDAQIKLMSSQVEIEEKGVKLKLTVVDVPGYGEALDCSGQFEPIINYIDQQYERYLNYESGLNRHHIADTRVHCCFYFLNPNNYSLKPADIYFMKQLHTKVNIVPIIAKADFLTKDECQTLKKRILDDIKKNGIRIYSIPDPDPDEDDDYKEHIRQLKAAMPFAVTSSLDYVEVRGKKVLARSYPWGVIEVENPEHSDFVKLRSMLVSHMQDLREVTQDVHYENYRSQRLAGKIQAPDSVSIASTVDEEKDRMLQEKEAELKKMQEMLEMMQRKMMEQQQQQQQAGDIIKNGSGTNGSGPNV